MSSAVRPATTMAADSESAPLLRSRESSTSSPPSPARPATLALLLGRATGRGRGPSMLVRETAARELEERRADWGYSKPVVALDMLWNTAFVLVSVVMLIITAKKHQIVPGTWNIRSSFNSFLALLVSILLIAAVYLTQSNRLLTSNSSSSSNDMKSSRCNFFSGKWVFDNKTYPLYREQECTFMSDQLACQKFGRKDSSYQFWRWQPHQCDLPKFNGTALLERLRNKRLVFVGDSLNRGQWVSMVCLVDSSITNPMLKSMHHKLNGSLISFNAREYNASIEFYWAPLLVESNSDDPVSHRLPDRIVKVQSIEKHAKHWTDADILVFNSYLWWKRSQMKVLWGSFERPEDSIYKEVKMPRVYEVALETWSNWLEVHVNRTKTQLFFMTMSPTHLRPEEWGGIAQENCYNETDLITKDGYQGRDTDSKMMRIVESVIEKLNTRGLNVRMINITQLSEYRKEGHPSIYRRQYEPLTEKQKQNPKSYADCIHWCLPGVPDVWNELLYAYIFHQ